MKKPFIVFLINALHIAFENVEIALNFVGVDNIKAILSGVV